MSETPPCAWCGDPSVTDVITVPGRKNRQTAPVCENHAKDFENRGIKTVRVEADEKLRRQQRRNNWKVVRK